MRNKKSFSFIILLFLIVTFPQIMSCASSIALHSAAEKGNIEEAKSLIKEGIDVNAKDQDGLTPLHYATWEGHLKIVRLLIENGADINAKNKWGNTPLHYAIKRRHLKIVRLLIENGADINAWNEWGETPLDIAIIRCLNNQFQTKEYIDIAKLLIENNANADGKKLEDLLFGAFIAGKIDLAKLLIEKDKDKFFWLKLSYLLFRSIKEDKIDLAKLLIEKGVTSDYEDDNGNTTLSYAIKKGYIDIAKILIENGADINIKINGSPLLTYVSKKGYIDIIKLLIEKGANINSISFKNLSQEQKEELLDTIINYNQKSELENLINPDNKKNININQAQILSLFQKYLNTTPVNEKSKKFVLSFIKKYPNYNYYNLLYSTGYINFPRSITLKVTDKEKIEKIINDYTKSFDYKILSKYKKIKIKTIVYKRGDYAALITLVNGKRFITVQIPTTCELVSVDRKRIGRNSMTTKNRYECHFDNSYINDVKDIYTVMSKISHEKELFRETSWDYTIESTTISFGDIGRAIFGDSFDAAIKETFSNKNSTCRNLLTNCRENICKHKDDSGILSSNQENCEMECQFAYDECKKGNKKGIKQYLCKAKCTGRKKDNGGLMSSSDYEKCVNSCVYN